MPKKGKTKSPSKPTIYCNNLNCKYCLKLDEPFKFSWNSFNYTPFDDCLVTGRCTRKGYDFMSVGAETKNRDYRISMCHLSDFKVYVCDRQDCLHNDNRVCTRSKIWVNTSPFLPEDIAFYHCRCYSDKKVKGHMDWSRLLQPNGTSYGGHLTDSEAENMAIDNSKFRSYQDGHFREAKEFKRISKKNR